MSFYCIGYTVCNIFCSGPENQHTKTPGVSVEERVVMLLNCGVYFGVQLWISILCFLPLRVSGCCCTPSWKDEAGPRKGGFLQDPGRLGVSVCVACSSSIKLCEWLMCIQRGIQESKVLVGQVLTGEKWKFVGLLNTQPFPARGCGESGSPEKVRVGEALLVKRVHFV